MRFGLFWTRVIFIKLYGDRRIAFAQMPWAQTMGWGRISKSCFFKYEYKAGFLHIEAWIREGKNLETSLFGVGASDLKSRI